MSRSIIQRDVTFEYGGSGENLFVVDDVIDYLCDNGFEKKRVKKRVFGIQWSWLEDEVHPNTLLRDNIEVKLYEGDYGNMKHKIFKDDECIFSAEYIKISDVEMILRNEKLEKLLDGD